VRRVGGSMLSGTWLGLLGLGLGLGPGLGL
jgi:hypothetical protein